MELKLHYELKVFFERGIINLIALKDSYNQNNLEMDYCSMNVGFFLA